MASKNLILLFSGQGSQAKGFPQLNSLIENPSSRSWKLLQTIDDMFRSTFTSKGNKDTSSLLSIMRENPQLAQINGEKYSHPSGILSNTVFAQPAILAYQQACFEDFLEKLGNVSRREFFESAEAKNIYLAGHSLGEFSAVACLSPNVFESVSDAVELVTRRGLAMQNALRSLGLPGTDMASSSNESINNTLLSHFVMVAVNPKKAMLTEEQFLLLIELVSEALTIKLRRPHTLMELANDNIHEEQLVVAADRFSASVLGKCVDPQWRQSCVDNGIETFGDLVQAAIYDADLDDRAGVTKDPNAPAPKDFVPGSLLLGRRAAIGIPRWVSADGGVTLPEERLIRVSNIGAGRSGLKKKTFYNQLPVEVPFHSSALRHAFDELYQHVDKKVVKNASISRKNNDINVIRWIPNISGTLFEATENSFRKNLLETLSENVNVGEQSHHGKMIPKKLEEIVGKLADENSVVSERELIVNALTCQLCNVVCWSQTMETLLQNISTSTTSSETEESGNNKNVVLEFVPATSVLSDMLKKVDRDGKGIPKENYYLMPRDVEKCVKSFLKK